MFRQRAIACAALLVLALAAVPASAAAQRERAQAYYHFMLGRQLDGEGESERAIEEFREAARLDPGSPDIRAELAGLYARKDEADEAIKWGEAALRIDPANRDAHRVLGLVAASQAGLQEAGSLEDPVRQAAAAHALEHLEAARRVDRFPDPPVDLTLARLYIRTGKAEKAVPVLLRLLAVDPGRTGLLLMLAEAYEVSGQLQLAVESLQRAAGQAPGNPVLLDRLGDLLFRAGRFGEALGAWEGVLAGDVSQADRERIERKIRAARGKEPQR